MHLCQRNKIHGLTWLEVVVILALLAFLAFLLLPAFLIRSSGRNKPHSSCVSNTKSVALAFHLWAQDHHTSRFGFQVSTNEGGSLEYGGGLNTFRHFQTISNQLQLPLPLICPGDKQRLKARPKYSSNDANSSSNLARMWAGLSNQRVSYFVNLDAQFDHPQSVLLGDGNVTNQGFNPQQCLLASSNNPPHWTWPGYHGNSKDHRKIPAGCIALADGNVKVQTDMDFSERFGSSQRSSRDRRHLSGRSGENLPLSSREETGVAQPKASLIGNATNRLAVP